MPPEPSARIQIHAVPGSRGTAVAGMHGSAIKIRLAAPPVEGRANEELIRFLSERLAMPKSCIHIEHGTSSRAKRVRVDGLDETEAQQRLGITR